jgi:hypothetical protein
VSPSVMLDVKLVDSVGTMTNALGRRDGDSVRESRISSVNVYSTGVCNCGSAPDLKRFDIVALRTLDGADWGMQIDSGADCSFSCRS